MRFLLTMLVVLGVACVQNTSIATDDGERSVRFYGGEVVRAELKPGDDYIEIVGVDKYAPPSRVTSDVGLAVVSVRMDKGRSLSVYDYSLVNARKDVFPCIAIMNSVEEYDASLRNIKDIQPNQLYNLLFKIEMPLPGKKPRFLLRFNLRRGVKRDPMLTFVNLGKFPFTKTSKIPLDGMLGVIPECMKPKPKSVEKTIKSVKADDKAAKGGDSKQTVAKKAVGGKTDGKKTSSKKNKKVPSKSPQKAPKAAKK
jgi:hypothetical protein